ncbi:MAG TPA: LON peptidase substrate-binding domain-containing protein, partial [Candidatus Binatia bacterium]|nr:LON peptidase substrate-binding domain-containing protein [Candidatus Binatia bacterium]
MTSIISRTALPESLPIFPLTGVMLLPGTVLPLHIFEPRYRAMVEDSLEGDKIFAMIQPFVPQDDNRGPQPGAGNTSPDLYKVGCAGYIEKWEKFPDGRFFVQLRGVNRFRFNEEFALTRGYRRVKAIYDEFADENPEQGWRCQRQNLLDALGVFGKAHGMQVKPEQAERFSDVELVNLLSVSLPFHPAEKQALLEAPLLKDRENLLIDLLRLGGTPLDPET